MKYLLFTILCNIFALNLYAQLFPESFSYQAAVRDDEGTILNNANIGVRFTIIWDVFGQLNAVYSETHQTQTNEYGLFNLSLGTGTPGNGIVANFDEITWGWGYKLKVEIDTGNGYVDLGLEPMNAVPYSMYSKNNWGLNGNLGTNEAAHFIGTTDNTPLIFKTNNLANMALSAEGDLAIGHSNPTHNLDMHANDINICSIKFAHTNHTISANIGLYLNDLLLTTAHEEGKIKFLCNGYQHAFDDQGRFGVRTFSPKATIHAENGTDVSLGNEASGFLICGETNSANIAIDPNEILARNNSSAATLFLNTEGGAVVVNQNTTPPYDFYVNGTAAKPGGGSWASYSDGNLKHDVKSFEVGLETLLKVNPVNFKYIPEFAPDAETEYVGIIAQDLQKIAPFMVQSAPTVFEDGHSEEYLSVDPSAFTYMLINAVKEMSATMEQMNDKIELLEREITTLKKQ